MYVAMATQEAVSRMHKGRVNRISNKITNETGVNKHKAKKMAQKEVKSVVPEYFKDMAVLKVDPNKNRYTLHYDYLACIGTIKNIIRSLRMITMGC